MTLHLLKIEPDMERLVRWADGQRLLRSRGDDDTGYTLHALLAAVFGEFTPKPFSLQRSRGGRTALLAYSGHAPEQLHEHAATFAEPDALAALAIELMTAKVMPVLFAKTRRLGFTLRVRPTIRTDRGGDRDHSRERDAFLAAIDGLDSGTTVDRGAIYAGWLTTRLAAGGAAIERLTLDTFRLSETRRRGADRVLKTQRGPDASYSGVLRVEDPDAFASMLARGVGRHRAFGYGMLLLRPVS